MVNCITIQQALTILGSLDCSPEAQNICHDSGLQKDALARLLRAAVQIGFFRFRLSREEGLMVANNRLSSVLRTDHYSALRPLVCILSNQHQILSLGRQHATIWSLDCGIVGFPQLASPNNCTVDMQLFAQIVLVAYHRRKNLAWMLECGIVSVFSVDDQGIGTQ